MRLPLAAILLALLLLPLSACDSPPASDYVHGVAGSKPVAQISIGKNAVGESCTQSAGQGQAADIYCGTWQEPSARVRAGTAGNGGSLAQLATSARGAPGSTRASTASRRPRRPFSAAIRPSSCSARASSAAGRMSRWWRR